jgi:neuronal guanine nucleotide exchange factor
MFLNEPLYQLYTAAKLESISSGEFENEPENESDGYEEVFKKDSQGIINGNNDAHNIVSKKKQSRPSALQLIEPNHGPSRTLWSEVPEVIQSGILSTLTTNEKRLQEAKFEILTSEASYLKSLNLLKSHFMNHPAFRDPQNLDPQDRKTLFSYIIPVQECADKLLCDLESCWQDSIMLKNLAKNIFKHAEKHFHVYISYCEHQGRLDRTLKRLKEHASFKETLDVLENDSICCGLTIHSFLMLPMQRITRLPLLIDAVMTKLKSNDEEFDDWKMTMAIANKVSLKSHILARKCLLIYFDRLWTNVIRRRIDASRHLKWKHYRNKLSFNKISLRSH